MALVTTEVFVKTQADGRLQGATQSTPWGRGGIMVVSPRTEHVITVDRLGGLGLSKSLHLPGVAPCAVVANRTYDQLWVFGERGVLVRLSNDQYQPAEIARTQLAVSKAPTWLVIARSPLDTGRLRNTSAQRKQREENTDDRIVEVISDFALLAPVSNGVQLFNASRSGIYDVGLFAAAGQIDAAAADGVTGYIYLIGQRGQGFIATINARTQLEVVSEFTFPNIEGAIQARVVGTNLHIISASRNRWQIWDLDDPLEPTLISDTPYDTGFYWANPLRSVDEAGDLHRRFGTETGFVPGNLPVTDAGFVTASPSTDPDLRWALLGDVAQITMTVPDVLPFKVYRTGGSTSNT